MQNNDAQSARVDKNTCTETSYQPFQADDVAKLDRHVQITFPSAPGHHDSTSEMSLLDTITRKVKTILNNYNINGADSGESIFETIAKQYVDTKWKLDVLERKVTEVTRDLKETEEMKDGLQIECDEMQSHINSLLLENRALQTKSSFKLELPSIPETSEERVASLETDMESLQQKLKCVLAENRKIRERNSALTRAAQSREGVPLIRVEDVHREASLEENKLQRKIALSRDIAQQTEELPASLEKDRCSSEDAEEINNLKLENESLKQEIPFLMSETDSLKGNLDRLENAVDQLTSANKDLRRSKKQLEMELDKYREEKDVPNEDDFLLDDLQKQLHKVTRENFDLQNELSFKNKELEETRIEIDAKQFQVAKLCQDNDRLIKENVSLSEQLTATHNESFDKIELLNTEMTLLEQEYEDLKQETSIYKEELTQMKERLYGTQDEHTKVENECCALKARCKRLETEKEDIQGTVMTKVTRVQELENELSLKESEFIEKLSSLQDRCKLLQEEVEVLRAREAKSQKNIAEVSSANSASENLGAIENATERARLMNEVIELRDELMEAAIKNNEESAKMTKRIEDLSLFVRDKDDEINVLRTEIARAKATIAQTSNDVVAVGKQKNELEQLVAVKCNESLQYQQEIEKLTRLVNDQTAYIKGLMAEAKETPDKTNMDLSHKCDRATNGQMVEQVKQKEEIAILNEKCGALEAALIQEQSNSRMLQNQLNESQGKEANAAKELERLRTHLVEMESSYTEEALIAEKSREELEAKLLQAEEKVKSSSTAYTSANVRANQQLETLQQQMALIVQQRDQIQAKLSTAEDNVLLQSASLTNLQIVLEQFQQGEQRSTSITRL